MKPTLPVLIIDELKGMGDWVSGTYLERYFGNRDRKPATVSRTLRIMAQDKLIYKDYDYPKGKPKTVKYKFKKLIKKKC